MINGIKGSRVINKTEAGNLFAGDGLKEMIIKGKESSFSGMEFGIGRLADVEE
jgi:hypothetical protein